MTKPPVTELDQHIGQRLKALRKQYGISAEQLGEMVGLSQQQLSRYENGSNKLGASQLYALSQTLRVPLSWFFHDYQPERPYPSAFEATPAYQTELAREELQMVADHWANLTPAQRTAIVKLVDTFIIGSQP